MKFRILQIATIGFLLYVLLVGFFVSNISAVEYWNDAIEIYPKSRTVVESIREITNTDTDAMDVKVEYDSGLNISLLKSYYLTGNGITFIQIENGALIKTGDTKTLKLGEKLIFNIESEPIDLVLGGETCSITVLIMRTTLAIVAPSRIWLLGFFVFGGVGFILGVYALLNMGESKRRRRRTYR